MLFGTVSNKHLADMAKTAVRNTQRIVTMHTYPAWGYLIAGISL